MMYLCRLTLKRTPSARALAALIDPTRDGQRMGAQHRLIWSAFAGDPEVRRDFLWRDMGRGQFMVLCARKPEAAELFEPPEVKPFAPALAPGDRLRFVLRANATRTVTEADGRKRHRDVVMEALKPIPGRKDLPEGARSQRAPMRLALAQEAGHRWLERQGKRAGFQVRNCGVSAYRVVRIPDPKKLLHPRESQDRRFGILDFEGVLELADPVGFLACLTRGFGRAKAFGCGLMLIRRC